MIAAPIDVSWTQAGWWLAGIFAGGFLVAWLVTDLARTRRTPYIGVLTAATVAATGAYLTWADVGVVDFLTHRAGWGVLGGLLVAVPVARGITQLPATTDPEVRRDPGLHLWEGLIYGVTEGILLSALPPLVVWHAADTAGWTDKWPATLATAVLAVLAGAVMIAVHHFGYWDYRSRKVLPVIGGVSLLTIAFVATGSVLAPVIGHVAMHVAGLVHGAELPPHAHQSKTPEPQAEPSHAM